MREGGEEATGDALCMGDEEKVACGAAAPIEGGGGSVLVEGEDPWGGQELRQGYH
jgi:hypothetical protein